MITLTGKKISEGIAVGKLLFYKRDTKEIKKIYVKDVEKEIQRFQRAREKAVLELKTLYDTALREVGEANAAIFDMQREILENQEYIDLVNGKILEEKLNAEYIVKSTVTMISESDLLQQKGYSRGHEADIKDVSFRLIRILSRSLKDLMFMDEPFILASSELYPSDVLQLDKSKVLGFITMHGTVNSHTSILARTKGFPAVIGLGEVLKEEYEGKTIIVDGYEGKVYIEPDYTTLTKMKERRDSGTSQRRNLERLKGKENITQSGQSIEINANVGTREDVENAIRSDAGGIGLFRSEFLYMETGNKVPSEEQLVQVYKLAAESMGSDRVVIRLPDFGGDKMARCIDLGEQKNPAIGLRGLKVLFEKEEILLTQIRAILRVSVYKNVSMLLPMITSLEEVEQVKQLIEKVKHDLKEEKIAYNENIQVGVMIETPAAVMISGELAREADFFSIGTNDLTMLTLGIDRTNEKAAKYFDPHHPALLKMIRIIANNVHLEGKHISVCGELAADLSMTEYFIQIGIDELSVAPNQVLELRKKIRDIQ